MEQSIFTVMIAKTTLKLILSSSLISTGSIVLCTYIVSVSGRRVQPGAAVPVPGGGPGGGPAGGLAGPHHHPPTPAQAQHPPRPPQVSVYEAVWSPFGRKAQGGEEV